MKFPQHNLNIDEYLTKVKSLINDLDCEIFIDTNIISQLYRLNDNARNDFYDWIEKCKGRFHIPVWSIHEYSKRVYSKNTNDYLAELSKIQTCSKELHTISEFVKGYVGESLLKGSIYQDKTEELFSDIDKVNDLLEKINKAINSKRNEHQSIVHKEIIDKLQLYALNSDVYGLLKDIHSEPEWRFDGKIPPGFKDDDKSSNRIGDLIIWKELLAYCANKGSKKAILISRDCKQDFTYLPDYQICDGRKASNTEKLRIAHESLVYEFQIATGSDEFVIIEFATFVKIIASQYRNLAKSFQIATAQEYQNAIVDDGEWLYVSVISNDTQGPDPNVELDNDKQVELEGKEQDIIIYSADALQDSLYNCDSSQRVFDKIIEDLRNYNWYVQNPAINQLMKFKDLPYNASEDNLNSTFVLGRNITQCAEGSSGSAISFIEHLHSYISSWPLEFKRALVDGLLYEVFFNANGLIRPKGFKATYYEDMMREIPLLGLPDPYAFVNSELKRKGRKRFVPTVGSNEEYTFRFKLDDDNHTTNIYCNDNDISDTFKYGYYSYEFSSVYGLKSALSIYFAILEKSIIIDKLPAEISSITYCTESFSSEDLPF